MTEAARDLNVLPAATTEGMEDIFDVRELDASKGRERGPHGREQRRTGRESGVYAALVANG